MAAQALADALAELESGERVTDVRDTSVDKAAEAAEAERQAVAEALKPFVTEAMDATVGRYQCVSQDPRTIPEFLNVCAADMEQIIRAAAEALIKRRDEQAMLQASISEAPLDAASRSICSGGLASAAQEALLQRVQRDNMQLKASELFLRSISSEVIKDLQTRNHQVQVLNGVVKRRDSLLTDQRKAYLRELMHLRTIIGQYQQHGHTTLNDAAFYNWNEDNLAGQIAEEQDAAVEAARDEERAKFEKELEAAEARAIKMEEDLRRQMSYMEKQLMTLTTPIPMTDGEMQTEMEVTEVEAQTDPVVLLDADDGDEPPLPPVTVSTPATEEPTSPAANDRSPTPLREGLPAFVVCTHCGGDVAIDGASPATSPKRKGKKGGKKPPTPDSPRGAQSPPPSEAIASPKAGAGGSSTDADVVALREQLAQQKAKIAELRQSLVVRDRDLSTASQRKLDDEQQRRRAEQQSLRKLQDDVRTKDALLEQKGRELTQLQEETRRWFEQYKASQPPDQAPINHATIRKLMHAVETAEAAEEEYRTLSWKLIGTVAKYRGVLQGLVEDCNEAEADKNIPELRRLQRGYDTVANFTWAKTQRLRQQRTRQREESNRLWDVVLFYARSVRHPEEPVAPPPRYYAVRDGGNGDVGPGMPPSPTNRKQELQNVMLQQSLKNNPVAAVAVAGVTKTTAGLAPAASVNAKLPATPRGTRPSTAPTQRATQQHTGDGGDERTSAGPRSNFGRRVVEQVLDAQQHEAPDFTVLPSKSSGGKAGRPSTAAAPNTRAARESTVLRPGAASGGTVALSPTTPHRPHFSPSALRGRTQAQQRTALMELMRYDQDMLAVARKRHVDSVHHQRNARHMSVHRGAAAAREAGVFQQRLIGRNEYVT